MVLVKDAIHRTFRDLSQIGYRLVVNPFQIHGKYGFLKIVFSFLVVCFLLFGVSIFPSLTEKLSSNKRDTIYLNIIEPPVLGKSSICKFQARSEGNLILNTTLSEDGLVVLISFPDRGLKKINCLPYDSNPPFHEPGIEGTIISIFSSQGHEFFSNNTAKHEKNVIVKSKTPLRVFIMNKDAVMVHFTNLTASLIKSIVNLEYKVEKIVSKDLTFLDFTGEFVFYSGLNSKAHDSLKKPKIFLYGTPELDEVDFTSLSTFKESPNLKVNFGFKDFGERMTFVRLVAQLDTSSTELIHLKDLKISKFEFVDSVQVKQPSVYPKITYYVLLIFASLFAVLFSFNLFDLAFNKRKTEHIEIQKKTD